MIIGAMGIPHGFCDQIVKLDGLCYYKIIKARERTAGSINGDGAKALGRFTTFARLASY